MIEFESTDEWLFADQPRWLSTYDTDLMSIGYSS